MQRAALDEKELNKLETHISDFARKNNLSFSEVLAMIDSKDKLPISVFSDKLSPLESVVKYLREEMNLTFKEISGMLGKEAAACWTAYKNASKKDKKRFSFAPSKYDIPLTKIHSDRLSILEIVSLHLKDDMDLGFREIGKLIGRDERTIWTTYHRANKKVKSK